MNTVGFTQSEIGAVREEGKVPSLELGHCDVESVFDESAVVA